MPRRARRGDAPAIAELWLHARRTAEIPAAVHGEAEVHSWVADLLLPSSEVWVVTDGEELVAMMALRDESIDQLYVSPQHQRRGHGRRLLELAQARSSALELWTFESNSAARHFYEAHGFSQSGPPSDENEERAPALRYRWRR
ncbi:MAG TPA: GNAT family N-acetyltransferase [Solirubrobacteraceae bacterium]|nr:GNAT family N-acetyltransferase [Solirubrobacteraceae bacterium]